MYFAIGKMVTEMKIKIIKPILEKLVRFLVFCFLLLYWIYSKYIFMKSAKCYFEDFRKYLLKLLPNTRSISDHHYDITTL